jgi:ELWxxDGT repeat protein
MPRRTAFSIHSAVLVALLSTLPALAQPAAMVKDIGQTEIDFDLGSFQTVPLGGILYFIADDGIHGRELWRSDGTAAGTELVRDICPGACSGPFTYLVSWSGKLYFPADDDALGVELHESDGTAAGTKLVKDVAPGRASGFSRELIATSDRLYFVGRTEGSGEELWTSLGTEASTTLVAEIHPTSDARPSRFVDLAGTLLFFADDGTHGAELWRTQGTGASTSMVTDLTPGAPGSASLGQTDVLSQLNFGATGLAWSGKAFYVLGGRLLATDGTAGGTSVVYTNATTASLRSLLPWNGHLYFISALEGLARTDGVSSSVVVPGEFAELAAANWGLFLFHSGDGNGLEPWRSDGTVIGTTPLLDLRSGPDSSLPLPFALPTSSPDGGAVFFWANDGVHGAELWRTDGTPAGTVLVADFVPGPGDSALIFSLRERPQFLGNTGYLRARTAADSTQTTLFAIDGAVASAVTRINRQRSGFALAWYYNGRLEFNLLSGSEGGLVFTPSTPAIGPVDLWGSSGTEAGTQVLASASGESWEVIEPGIGDRTFVHHLGDGLLSTEVIPAPFESIASAAPANLGFPWRLPTSAGRAYFSQGDDMWRSDGTAPGTSLVEADAGIPFQFMGTDLYLRRTPSGGGDELRRWREGEGSVTLGPFDALNLALAGGRHLFFDGNDLRTVSGATTQVVTTVPCTEAAFTGTSAPWGALFTCMDSGDVTLWITDGTVAGTHLVKEIATGARPSDPHAFVQTAWGTLFAADDGLHGRELWTSDGTETGTHLVVDLVPGPAGSVPDQLTIVDGLVLFGATDAMNGKELWVSNGTAAGTVMLQNIAPGAASSTPHEFTVGKDRVFFIANDATRGFELWSMLRSDLAFAAPPAAAAFFTVPPCRLIDSRNEGGPLLSGSQRVLSARNRCEIPPTARSLAANLTLLEAPSSGLFTIGSNDARFGASEFPIVGGKTRATQLHLRLSPSGDGTFHVGASLGAGGSVGFVVDIVGYYE